MSTPVELIVGPARSGKAGRVLAAYLDALAGGGPGRALMLVPTGLRRRATESRLLAAQRSGVLIRPQVLTLPDLADHLLTAAGRPVRRISELARRQVIRQCLAGLDKKNAAVLGAVRDAPGLIDALDGLFRELKAARVEPDDFLNALSGGLRSPRNRVLAILYGAYQKALQGRDVYDDAGQFWHAAALVAEGGFGPFRDLEVLAVDGFQDFAPAQLDVLDALSRRARCTLITLTWEPDRPNVFGVTDRTRRILHERFAGRLTETVVSAPSGLGPSLERVRTHLFRLADDAAPPRADGSIRIIRAAGRTREVEEVARQVVDLVRGGAAAPGSVAVLVRSLEPYAALVREVFPRYGVAFRVEGGRRLADAPIVRAAMALVRLQAEDYSFRAVSRLLKSNYFSPAAFGADAATVRDAIALAREANVWTGRDAYAKGLEYLRGLARRSADLLDDSGELVLPPDAQTQRLAKIDRVDAFLRAIFERLALPVAGTRRVMADRLREVIRAAGLWTVTEPPSSPDAPDAAEAVAHDLKAIAAFEEVLEEVALLGEDDTSEIPLERFVDEVTQGLGLASVPSEEPRDAPVAVMDVRQARALAFDHVFVLGLAEKAFPRRGRRHPFFDDAERTDLRGRKVDLADAGHDAEQEMLLFYIAATRARKSLVLAYPSLDSQGRPALASHYLEEVRGLFAPGEGGDPLPVTDVGTRDLDLPEARLRAPRELVASTMFSLWGPGETERPDEHLAVLHTLLAGGRAAETALTGLAAEWEREHGEAFGPFDGCLSARRIVDDLCRRFPGGTTMSARRLETFGGCPFAYFAGEILGLRAAEEPSPDLGPLEIGLIYHGLLERFFAALAASKTFRGRLTGETRDAGLRLLDETAETYFDRLAAQGRTGSAALWKIQRKNILRDVRRLVEWHIEKQADWRVAYLEVAFGAVSSAPPRPPGRREPITVDTPHGPVRVRGRIDRIDLAADGEPGFQVIDYKTGAAPSVGAMKAGLSFQLPIYLWAARAVLAPGECGERAQAFFLPIRAPARTGLLASHDAKGHPKEAFDQALDRAAEYIRRFTDAMRCGLFPVYPRGGCSEHCDFQGICRYAEWRVVRKWELHPIAPLEVMADDAAAAGEGDA